MTEEWYLLFPSVHDGMKMEKVLKANSFKCVIVPTPRALSMSCGIAMKVDKDQIDVLKTLITKHNIRTSGFHSLSK